MDTTEPKRDDRQIRVFISSTFKDMQDERDYLVKNIFPQLRKLCESRAVTWTEVDLRWGITEAESSEGKVLPLCLAEIERCRPYFIGLLGERYGWVPAKYPENLIREQSWLKEHLHHSVTELEIIHGVLKSPKMLDRSLFYFRDPKYLGNVPKEKKADFAAESVDHAEKLSLLKQRIRDEHTKGKLKFAPRENYPTPKALGEMILADFTQIIDNLYPTDQVPDPLDQEAARHEAYARSRRMAFIGREDLLEKMTKHVMAGGKPIVLTGESGCGKSALLAEWVALWGKNHPEDLIIQHYIGSTPDSANWQAMVRRILDELNRAYNITDPLPIKPGALRTALNDWLVKTAGKRRIILVLDALNQLADEDAAHQLGWLPFVFPPNVRVLVSSLAGDTYEAVHKRQWSELNVPLFGKEDIAPAAKAYFKVFGKTPDDRMIQTLQATPATTNALYLRAVLDELRQFGRFKELPQRTAWYLAAADLSSLFDRILSRWHDDFEKDTTHPDLVRRSLCLIACSRFGIAESELLDLLGKKNEQGENKSLPRRFWTPLYLAAENSLSIRTGLLNFGHDYLCKAVHRRWLADKQIVREFRTHLANYFSHVPGLTGRKLDELPTLLRDTEQWTQLKDLLADIPTFLRLRSNERWKWELHGFWIPLRKYFDSSEVYRKSLAAWETPTVKKGDLSYLLSEVAMFYLDAGDYRPAEPLYRQALEGYMQASGPEHPNTLTSMNNLAALLKIKGDYVSSEALYQSVLEISDRVLGPEHTDTLRSVNNLAELRRCKGDYASAESMHRKVLKIRERDLDQEHPDTLISMNNMAVVLRQISNYTGVELLYRRVLEARERILGLEHPETLTSVNNLALLLKYKGNYADAKTLYNRALEGYERVLGPEHPNTLLGMNNLALLLDSKRDYAAAEMLLQRTVEICTRVMGPDHPDTLLYVNNLAGVLHSKGDYDAAEILLRRTLKSCEQVLGREHPDTLACVNNLAALLQSKDDCKDTGSLYRWALEGHEQVLGQEHPNTLISLNNLAEFLKSKGNYVDAEPLYRRLLEAYEKLQGSEHPNTLMMVHNLAQLLFRMHDYMGAESLYRRILEALLRILMSMTGMNTRVDDAINNYAAFLREMGLSQDQIELKLNEILRPFGRGLGG